MTIQVCDIVKINERGPLNVGIKETSTAEAHKKKTHVKLNLL